MSSKRREDLEKKLTMGRVPSPPAGLSERIKAEIPNYLHAAAAASGVSTGVVALMRVAASLILLLTTAFLALHLLETPRQNENRTAARWRPAERVFPAARTTETTAAMSLPASAAAPSSLFGVSTDAAAFSRLAAAIASGAHPSPDAVDADTVATYFAGEPVRRPKDASLEVEASSAPAGATRHHAILRVTIDTAAPDSDRPVGRQASLAVEINEKAVRTAHRIGGGALTRAGKLPRNASVTLLYDLELRPRVSPTESIANVRLRYRAEPDGKERTIAMAAGEGVTPWSSASLRHRLAALGAFWSEAFNEGTASPEIAREAAALASEYPADARARELANLARATDRGSR